MASRKHHLPPTIFVVRRDDAAPGDPYLVADVELEGYEDGEIVGTYELTSTAPLKVRRELEAARARVAKAKADHCATRDRELAAAKARVAKAKGGRRG